MLAILATVFFMMIYAHDNNLNKEIGIDDYLLLQSCKEYITEEDLADGKITYGEYNIILKKRDSVEKFELFRKLTH